MTCDDHRILGNVVDLRMQELKCLYGYCYFIVMMKRAKGTTDSSVDTLEERNEVVSWQIHRSFC